MLKPLGGGKVTILDANPDVVAKKHTFETTFRAIYEDTIDDRPGTPIIDRLREPEDQRNPGRGGEHHCAAQSPRCGGTPV